MAQIDSLDLVERAATEETDVPARPDARADMDRRIANLFAELTSSGILVGLAPFDAATWRAPP